MIGFIILGLIVIIGLYFLMLYNGLVTKKLRVDEAWSQIDVQLKRRADLIPNLVEVVKGYAKHEKTVFEEVTKARSALMSASSLSQKAQADNQLSAALKSILAVAEAYPKLEASQNFKDLHQELSDTEDKVAYSRQFYNNVVMEFNTDLKVFPNVVFAPMLGFKDAEFFGKDLTEQERKVVNDNL
ncbi:MAG: LemA family protein [bacterium]|nr:LemA family protein [bacterium]